MKIPKVFHDCSCCLWQTKNYSSVPPLWLPNTAPVVTHHIQFLRWRPLQSTIGGQSLPGLLPSCCALSGTAEFGVQRSMSSHDHHISQSSN